MPKVDIMTIDRTTVILLLPKLCTTSVESAMENTAQQEKISVKC